MLSVSFFKISKINCVTSSWENILSAVLTSNLCECLMVPSLTLISNVCLWYLYTFFELWYALRPRYHNSYVILATNTKAIQPQHLNFQFTLIEIPSLTENRHPEIVYNLKKKKDIMILNLSNKTSNFYTS